ncbi:MAG: metal ABC transporter substrate-binding protein [Candidatus Cloacimonetes bacterium]|nr:metal ABC transporter substrate-binding protein [Candidatus Cloacimonadota bacterium]
MKTLGSIILIMLIALSGCKAPAEKKNEEKVLILASIYPYELLLKQMVGDAIEVRSIIPPNASVHSFSPQPSDLKNLHKAELILINGMGLEDVFMQHLSTMKEKLMISADLLNDLIALDSLNQIRHMQMHQLEKEHEEHNHQHAGGDPHLWTSPKMMLKLATKLKTELVSRFPSFAPLITHNYENIIAELNDAHEKIEQERTAFREPALVTYHNSFHYFAAEYDINYLGWVQSSPGREPSPRELARLGAKIRDHGVRRIFIEPQQNPKSAEVLAREYKLDLGTLDPIGSTLEAKTIAQLILINWESMKQAF